MTSGRPDFCRSEWRRDLSRLLFPLQHSVVGSKTTRDIDVRFRVCLLLALLCASKGLSVCRSLNQGIQPSIYKTRLWKDRKVGGSESHLSVTTKVDGWLDGQVGSETDRRDNYTFEKPNQNAYHQNLIRNLSQCVEGKGLPQPGLLNVGYYCTWLGYITFLGQGLLCIVPIQLEFKSNTLHWILYFWIYNRKHFSIQTKNS